MSKLFQDVVQDWMKDLQDNICRSLEMLDGTGTFKEEKWNRAEGGGGRTRVMENEPGQGLFEKAGVNFSAVSGPMPAFLEKEIRASNSGYDGDLKQFFATGVSLVLHPLNPHVPIVHMNVRYFRVNDAVQWFGGGIDLTPIYVVEDDARFFHLRLKEVCDQHDASYYPEFKKWADDYFFIPHRDETRGVGGIFFDRLTATAGITIEDRFAFVKDVGICFAGLYGSIASRNRDKTYDARQVAWQGMRRGRYAEFNLVYDRGTRFGLETGGRTESILMSLPPQANWKYNVQPEKDSEEYKTLGYLKRGINWIQP